MSYHYFEIYPKSECGQSDRELYFIEFTQFFKNDPIHWKLYKRQFILPPDEYERLKKETPENTGLLIMGNEGHPWWLLDGELQPDGTVPDKSWLLWMVDALNEKSSKETI